MSALELVALGEVVQYLWDAEEKDYEASPTDEHIFNHLITLRSFIDNYKIV